MRPLATWLAYRRLLRTQWLEPDALRRLQRQKLQSVVDHAYDTVPYYRHLFDEAGVRPGEIRGPEDLARLPVTTKKDLQEAGPEATVSCALRPADRIEERTSGSTGRPLGIVADTGWTATRAALFLRALAAAGYRTRRRLLRFDAQRRPPRRLLRWRYVAHDDAPDEVAAEWNAFEPWTVYGWVTPLRRLAEHVLSGGACLPAPHSIVTTAESLDRTTRALLESAFRTRVHEAYGCTETGFAAWECSARQGLHVSEDAVVVELLPSDSAGAARRLVLTSLEQRAMPFLRYDVGDLALPGPEGRCPCGRHLRRLERIEGRGVDCVLLPDGRLLSPYLFTLALERIAEMRRYQVVQTRPGELLVRWEGSPEAQPVVDESVERSLRGLVGAEVLLRVDRVSDLSPPAGRKFRIVESLVRGRDGSEE